MKLATAALLIAPAVAFAPATSFGARRTALYMATETAEETKVSFRSKFWNRRRHARIPTISLTGHVEFHTLRELKNHA